MFVPSRLTVVLIRTLEGVRHALGEVRANLAPPNVTILEKIVGAWVAQCITVAAELKVADALADGPLTVDALADRVGADADALGRLLRALVGEGIFTRRRDGRYELNARAAVLRSDAPGSLAALARWIGYPEHREHWSHLVDGIRTGEAVVPKLRGMPAFEYLASEPEMGAVFNDAMTGLSALAIGAVVAAYDFAPFDTVVDVGGGHGTLLSAILGATPSARGVLFDLPEVVRDAGPVLDGHGVGGRVDVVAGSFFETAPAGDLHVSKNVIHDWPDAEAVAILSNVRAAAAEGSVLLLVEFVLPADGGASLGNVIDLEMLVQTAARERTAAEYGALLERSGYRLTRVVPTAGPLSLIEGRAI